MICRDAVVSLYGFLAPFVIFVWLFTWHFTSNLFFDYGNNALFVTPLVYFGIVCILIRLICNGNDYQIALRAAFLGCIFGTGIYIWSFAPQPIHIFGWYMCVMAFFHYSEYLTIAIIHPDEVSTDAFVINHSPQYIMAAVSSWVEFALECYFFPGLKSFQLLSTLGLLICILGELVRKVAMLTASSNFNHQVQSEKSDDHVLVTHGIYQWSRHPSYVGWFYWSIGTQIILLNPFCIIAYAIASWFFFSERIIIEEMTLLNFFGQQYCDYQQKVGTGLPFIKGYKIQP